MSIQTNKDYYLLRFQLLINTFVTLIIFSFNFDLKYYLNILKGTVLVIILCMMYYQIKSTDGLQAISSIAKSRQGYSDIWLLGICIILMPINWVLESIKWKLLMSPHINMTFVQALYTVLSGVGAGIMTPARLGEYGGRLVTSPQEMKTQVISATLLSSIAQNLINIGVGLAFSYFFLKNVFGVTYEQGFAFCIAVSIQILILIWLYYNLPKVAHFIEKYFKFKIIVKASNHLKSLNFYKTNLLNKVLALSFARYGVYFMQYFFIMKYLGVSDENITLLSNISGIYLIQTSIPLPGFLSVFARGELAILVWSSIGVNQMIALIATFGLWILNLIIPSIIGIFILFKTDLRKYFN